MGVFTVTYDSFSPRSRFPDPDAAIARALVLADEGASVIDIGGECSRPGALPSDAETELARVIPVVAAGARRTRGPISGDTTKASVAGAAAHAGAAVSHEITPARIDP